MAAKKILYIAQEIMPYVPENEISKLCRQLPQAIQDRKNEVRLFMPRYGHINERKNHEEWEDCSAEETHDHET